MPRSAIHKPPQDIDGGDDVITHLSKENQKYNAMLASHIIPKPSVAFLFQDDVQKAEVGGLPWILQWLKIVSAYPDFSPPLFRLL